MFVVVAVRPSYSIVHYTEPGSASVSDFGYTTPHYCVCGWKLLGVTRQMRATEGAARSPAVLNPSSSGSSPRRQSHTKQYVPTESIHTGRYDERAPHHHLISAQARQSYIYIYLRRRRYYYHQTSAELFTPHRSAPRLTTEDFRQAFFSLFLFRHGTLYLLLGERENVIEGSSNRKLGVEDRH